MNLKLNRAAVFTVTGKVLAAQLEERCNTQNLRGRSLDMLRNITPRHSAVWPGLAVTLSAVMEKLLKTIKFMWERLDFGSLRPAPGDWNPSSMTLNVTWASRASYL